MSSRTSTLNVREAMEIAIAAHGDQQDRDGSYHVAHVARVADGCCHQPDYLVVAWLHDVLEDTEYDPDDLKARLSLDEWEALCRLTRRGGVTYQDYISEIATAPGRAGELAREVKRADLLDNIERCIAQEDPAVGRYGRALETLWRDQS